jgi:hypothetical protein
MSDYERVLEECLEALRQGRSVEDLLALHAQHADALRPALTAADALRDAWGGAAPHAEFSAAARERFRIATGERLAQAYHVQPDPAFAREARRRFTFATGERMSEAYDLEPSPSFFAAARVRFLMTAARLRRETAPAARRIPSLMPGFRALAGVSAALVLFLGFSTYTVASASSALPGDWRYPVKLQTERVRLALALSEGAKRDVRLDLAHERARELRRLAQRGHTIGPSELHRLVAQTAPLVSDADGGDWDANDLERLQQVSELQKTVLQEVAPQVEPAAQDELAQAVDVSKDALRVSTVEIVSKPPPVVITPNVPLTTPTAASTPTPPPTDTPTTGAETAAASPTPTFVPASPEATPTLGGDIEVGRTPVDETLGVTWIRMAVGRLTALIPSPKDGWNIAGVNVLDGPVPAPTLVHVNNATNTSLITINPRNGDMYWYIAHNGRFDEIQMRLTVDGQTLVVDPDVLRAAYGQDAEIALYVMRSITIEQPPTPTPAPSEPAPAP